MAAGCRDRTPNELGHALDLADQPFDPLAQVENAVVLIFVRTDCPISNRYAPEVKRLHSKFAEQGTRFYLVYPDADESAETIRGHLREYDYPCEALRDPDHALVEKSGASITPEVAVYGAKRTMVYRGRIDDWYVNFGEARPEPTQRDLEEALTALSTGDSVATRTTDAVGCYISDLK